MLNLSIIGAGNGEYVRVSGKGVDPHIVLGKGQVTGLYHAPVDTSWKSARRQRGATFDGITIPSRDMNLGFHVTGEAGELWSEHDARLRSLFTYRLDEWWADDELAQIEVELDGEIRRLHVQMREEPEFKPDLDPSMLQWGNTFYKLRAAQPMWEGQTKVTSWQTGSSGVQSGMITVSNPTDQPMFHKWVCTPGTWTLPDVQWSGPRRQRVADTSRQIELRPVSAGQGGLVVDLDPMKRMFRDQAGQNVAGQVAAGYWFLYEIPPYTPPTDIPVTVDAPAGGARVELRQPRLWSRPFGMW